MSGWIGVDLDGTLAEYSGWKGGEHIGDPIPAMMDRVRYWLRANIEVRIFTARASVPEYVPYVEQWLVEHELGGLQITCQKDFDMVQLWDDRCVRVETNTGQLADQLKHL